MSCYKNVFHRRTGKFGAFVAFALGFLFVFAILNIHYVIYSSSAKGITASTKDQIKKIQNNQTLRITGNNSTAATKSTSIPTTTPNFLNTTQTPTTESAIMKELYKIESSLKDFDNKFKKITSWEKYREHREKLKAFVHTSNVETSKKRYDMFHPHVLVDKVTLDCKRHYKVVVLVTSYAKHFERREWIRKAWGNQTFWNKTHENWQVIFNVGAVESEVKETYKKLMVESQKYGDLLVLDIPEDFHKLSQKVMAALFWVYTTFSFEFVFKTDDDVFIHIHRLLLKLNTTWSDEHFIGHAMRGQPPERNKGRYGVSLEEWPGKYYDPYCSGGGYVLSHYIIEHMIPHFNWETPLKIDDAYIGHLVTLAGGKVYHDHRSFLMWNDWLEYLPTLVVTHPLKFADFREFVEVKVALEVGRIKTHEIQNFFSLNDYNIYKKQKKAWLSSTTQKPLKTTRKSMTIIRKPSKTMRKPLNTTQKPSRTTRKSTTITRKPLITARKQSRTTRKPSRATQKQLRTTRKP